MRDDSGGASEVSFAVDCPANLEDVRFALGFMGRAPFFFHSHPESLMFPSSMSNCLNRTGICL